MAGSHRDPMPKLTMSAQNNVTPTPKGTAHISASRFDLTNDSYSNATLSLTAQIAGYRVPVTSSSILSVKLVFVAARAITPVAASPRWSLATTTAVWTIRTLDPPARKSGHENLT